MTDARSHDDQLAEADLRHVRGDIAGAIALYDALIDRHSDSWAAHANRGLAHAVTGRGDEARRGFRQALTLNPSAAIVLQNLIDSLLQDAHTDRSLPIMVTTLIALAPTAAESWLAFARVSTAFQEPPNAKMYLAKAAALSPSLPDCLAVLCKADAPPRRLVWALRLLACKETAETLVFAARYELLADDRIGARQHLCRAIALEPRDYTLLIELTGVIDGFAASEELRRWSLRAIRQNPASAAAWNNFGTAELALGRLLQAEQAFTRAVALEPDLAEAHFNRATPLFLLGREKEAWMEYDWRWQISRFESPSSKAPKWKGGPLAKRKLVVHDEQGIGDAINFVRYMPSLYDIGGHIMLACDPRLIRLFQASFPRLQVTSRDAIPEHDLSASLLDLPRLLGRGAASPAAPYLHAPHPASINAGGRYRVGLVWSGNPGHPRDRERSIPLDLLKPLFAISGIAWISLQLGPAKADVDRHGLSTELPDIVRDVSDTLDTARILLALDLVVTVDTAVAHLAGALGCPVWNLISWIPDWRWGMHGATTPWYPSMRLFRQNKRGDWPTVIEAVAASLRSARSDAAS